MYADDTRTTIASDDINELAQMMKEELQNISEWMRINKLSANPKKTEFTFIGHPRRINKIETLAPLKLNGTEITVAKLEGMLVMPSMTKHFQK